MSVERGGTDYSDPRVPNLPPFNAWLFPELWLNRFDGRIKGTANKIQPPIDANGSIKVDELMEELLHSVFRPDYDWQFDPSDEKTWPAYFRFYEGQDRLMPEQMRNALYGLIARAPGQGIEPRIGRDVISAEVGEVDELFLERHFSRYAARLGSTALDFKRPVDESAETIAANVAEGGYRRKLISIEALRNEVALQRENSDYSEVLRAA